MADLEKRSCSCNKWDLSGIPCIHVVSPTWYLDRHPEEYVHPSYDKDTYLRIYSHIVCPVNGPKLWPCTNMDPVLPSKIRPPKRLKKSKRRDPDKPSQSQSISRMHIEIKCSKCQQYGHNVRTCKGPIRGQPSLRKASSRGIRKKKPATRPCVWGMHCTWDNVNVHMGTQDSCTYVETPTGMGFVYREDDKRKKIQKKIGCSS